MRDEDKSREQLLTELQEVRQQLKNQDADALSDQAESDRTRDRLTAALGRSAMDLKASRAETAAGKEVLAESQESLRVSEQNLVAFHERYNVLGDLIPFGIWTADAKGNITFLSDAFLEMSGITTEETGRLKWVDQLARPVVKTVISEWSSALHQRDFWEREFTAVSEAGKKYDILIRGIPILDDKDNIVSWLGINLDISQRKRAEEKLRLHKEELEELVRERSAELARSEHLYRSTAANLPNAAVFIVDADLRFLLAEGSVLRDMGMKPADLEGKTINEALPTKLAEKYEPSYHSALAGDSVSMEHAAHGKHYISHIVPIHENGGAIHTALAVSYDITDCKRAEEAASESSREFQTLLESLPQVFVGKLDADLHFYYISPGVQELVGKPPSHFIGKRPSQTVFREKGLSDMAEATMRRVFESGKLGVFEYSIELPNGLHHRKVQVYPDRRDGDRVKTIIFFSYDVSELVGAKEEVEISVRKLEDRVRQRTAELERANRAKDEFLANMSHEIRTPMSGVLGLTEILLHQDLSDTMHRDLEMISNSAQSVMSLLNDLFDLSRINQAKLEFHHTEFDLRGMVPEAVAPLVFQARSKDLDFILAFDESTPPLVQCDKGRLAQVIKNLASNAIKFTDQGYVRIDLKAEEMDTDTIRLFVTVTDSGIGIPASKRKDIFNAFTQLDPSYSKRYGGMGLGLAICKSLVEGMGGKITVSSTKGKGATFSFYIPCAKATEMREPVAPGISLADLPSMTILLVEDNAVNRLFLRRVLVTSGHKVGEAENGEHALAKLRDTHFDLVLMDIQMPEMDGVEATQRIRSGRHGRPDIPIIALTAYAMKGDREKFLENGMDGYVTKPVDFGELARTIAKCALERDD